MDAHREMGAANITYDDVRKAAEENGKTVEETLRIWEQTAQKDRQDHPQEYQETVGSRA
jgi:hypothetical protein